MVKQITQTQFQSEVSDSPQKVLVEFFMDNCAPCKAIAPAVEAFAEANPDIKVVKINQSDMDRGFKERMLGAFPHYPAFRWFKDQMCIGDHMPKQQKVQTMELIIKSDLAQAVLNYLAKQPYDQVFQLIEAMRQLKAVPQDKPVEPKVA